MAAPYASQIIVTNQPQQQQQQVQISQQQQQKTSQQIPIQTVTSQPNQSQTNVNQPIHTEEESILYNKKIQDLKVYIPYLERYGSKNCSSKNYIIASLYLYFFFKWQTI